MSSGNWWGQKLACYPDLYSLMENQGMGDWRWVPGQKGRKYIPVGVSMPNTVQKVMSSAPHLQPLNRQGHEQREQVQE